MDHRKYATVLVIALLVITPSGATRAQDGATSATGDWRLRGRLQLDAASFDGGDSLLQDELAIRRGRLALSGNLWAGWRMKLEYELSGSTPGPKSIWLRHDLGDKGVLTLGHFKESLGLQSATSSRYSTFMERALPNVNSPGYRLGAKFATFGEYWSTSFGVTGGRLTDDHNHETDGVGVFFRGVLNPGTSKKRLWHFGASVDSRSHGTDDSIRLRSRPESDLTDERLVDSGRFSGLDRSLRYALEFAWKYKSLNVQSESFGIQVQRIAEPMLEFSGWYGQISWFVTGESRNYNRDRGSFGRTKPKKSFGAWEIAVRHSELDLNDGEVFGGEEFNTTIGLNWYASKNIRLSLNYVDAKARPDATSVERDISVVQGRFQFIF